MLQQMKFFWKLPAPNQWDNLISMRGKEDGPFIPKNCTLLGLLRVVKQLKEMRVSAAPAVVLPAHSVPPFVPLEGDVWRVDAPTNQLLLVGWSD